MGNDNKGLVIVYDPHNLYQFIWYYCNKGKDMKWDALCLPNDKKGEYMHPYCENTGIFENVYKYDDGFKSTGICDKLGLFAQMFGYYMIGQRKRFCKKLINRYVNWDGYERVVVLTCVGLISGACVALSKEKDVIILEDGGADYRKRKKWMEWKNLKSLYHWQGFILSHMGYCCPGWFYFRPEQNCIKYSSRPDKMRAGIYKEIRQLYSSNGTDELLLKSIVDRIYPQLKKIDFNKMPAIFLTIPLSDFVLNVDPYKEKLQDYLSGKYKNIILKRHPRDTMKYNFGDTEIIEIDNSIPAEAIMPYLRNMDVYMCEFCSTVMYAKPYNLHCTVLILDGYYEESISEGVAAKAPSEEEVYSYVRDFGGVDCVVVKI